MGAFGCCDNMTIMEDKKNKTSVISFFEKQIEYCRNKNQLGTARNYKSTLSSFRRFLRGKDMPFSKLTEELVQRYEQWLVSTGMSRNSSSFYLRNLRSVYNKAVKRKLAGQHYPFVNVYTGVDRTPKRAVNEDVIIRLVKLELNCSKSLAFSRDLFIFSYCARGMSFVDMAFLRKSDIVNGVITYVRRKTGQQLTVRIEPCMDRIIRLYMKETAASPYVFPIITATSVELAYRQYQFALNYHNRKLKHLGLAIGERLSLSSYTARHTWATAARRHNVPLPVISEAMGHASEKTTRIYLASLENSVIDEANKVIVRELNTIASNERISYKTLYTSNESV